MRDHAERQAQPAYVAAEPLCGPKPGVEYDVLGLGFVVDWKEGYFAIEGANSDGEMVERHDALRARATLELTPFPDADFDAENDADLRKMQISTVAVRRGQASFRMSLLAAYDGRCCITGCDLVDALEAAHITPYRGSQSNHPQNGLLLRADIHTLFDLGLLAVDQNRKLVLAQRLGLSQAYSGLAGITLQQPHDQRLAPSSDALQKHRDWTGL